MHLSDNKTTKRNLAALVDFSNLINSSLDLGFILNNLLLTCFGKFHTSRGAIFLVNKDGQLTLTKSKGLHDQITDNCEPIDINYESDQKFIQFLNDSKSILVKKIVSDSKFLGVILLGERLTGENYDQQDKDFLQTLLNISAAAIQNSLNVVELVEMNKDLDTKVHQLRALFDLSMEFSAILEIPHVCKLLGFSIIGQLLVSKYAVIVVNKDNLEILESKFAKDEISEVIKSIDIQKIKEPIRCNEFKKVHCLRLGELGVELIVPMKIKDETRGLILLGKRNIGKDYSKSDIEFVSSVVSLAIISIENCFLFKEQIEKQKLEKDLELAKKIQKQLLPSTLPQLQNFEVAAFNQAAKQVGGDYYDVIRLDENKVLVAIGDVSGKGVQAALLMANLQAFLQSISKQNNDLITASNLLNDLVSENTTDGRFITFFWGILDEKNKQFESVNMGHNPPLLIREGEIQKLRLGGMLMGVMSTITPYKSETSQLQKDDILIFFTDGITEAMNIDNEEYSDERFEKFTSELKGNTAEDIKNKILDDVDLFSKGREQSDDITIVVVKVK